MSSQDPRPRRRPLAARLNAPPAQRRHFLRRFWLPAVLLLAIAAGGLTGIIAAYQLNYSRAANEVASLATYRPSVVTRIYADDGETVIGEFALEKRIPLKYEELSPVMKNAILAIEDARFYDHVGIDPIRIVGVVLKNLSTGSREGGSTLTQQLAKNLFLSKEQTLKRKMNEWLLALQIERYYTKNQIRDVRHPSSRPGATESKRAGNRLRQQAKTSLEEARCCPYSETPRLLSDHSPEEGERAAQSCPGPDGEERLRFA